MVAAHVPDMDHFRGSFGAKHAIPLWRDEASTEANITTGILEKLRKTYGKRISPEDLFAYTYALLATPRYVDSFSEELTVPGPRLPLTTDATLFAEAANAGRELIFLHTYGERFVPAGGKAGQVPQGSARLHVAIPDAPGAYPEDFAYDPATRTLRVGAGEITGVDREVFEFSVSGFDVVKSWLGYRMKAGAGRKSSPLDEIRPERWTLAMSQELLQLLWMLEHTLARYPSLANLFDRVLAGPLFLAGDLPLPEETERKPPGRGEEPVEPVQQGFPGL